jgi:hypothetical protein
VRATTRYSACGALTTCPVLDSPADAARVTSAPLSDALAGV